MGRRRTLEALSNIIEPIYDFFGLSKQSEFLEYFPFIIIETLLLWIGLGHYFGGKRKKISNWELVFLCSGCIMDNTFSGIGFANPAGMIDESNIIYEKSCVFFQNLFNITAVGATRVLSIIEVSILYFYITRYGLNTFTRIMLHILNLIRMYLGYEWTQDRYDNQVYNYYLIDYLTFGKTDAKFMSSAEYARLGISRTS